MWRSIDLALRFIYVAAAPLILAALAAVMPLTGVMIGAVLATAVALFGPERWHRRVDPIPVLGRVLGGFGEVGEFYEEHPPKPLVYYIAYPLLLPVILVRRIPRREFLLYRKLNLVALLIVIASALFDYYRHWGPEIPFGYFLAVMFAAFVFELLATFAFVMPIVTTVLAYHRAGKRRLLWGLLACGALAGGAGAYRMHQRGVLPFSLTTRVTARSHYAPRETVHALADGLVAANDALVAKPDDLDGALDAALVPLAKIYHRDEVEAFRLYAKAPLVILYVRSGKRVPVWYGRDQHQVFAPASKNHGQLPPDVRKLLRLR